MLSDPALQLSLFGAFRLNRSGVPIRLPTRKTETLLAYLVLHPGPRPREALAALLWGDAPPERASASLRTALNALRRVLGPHTLGADRYHVEFSPSASISVDVREFEAAIRPQADLAAGARALELYSGDLLAGAYDDWIVPLREHYRQAFVEHLLRHTQALRAHSEYARAAASAERVLMLDPVNERAHQHLIFCRLAQGQRDAALAQYERLETDLRAEHGAEPLPETTALYHWIRQTPAARRSHAALRTNLPLPFSSFIGRERDLAAVKQRLSPTPTPPQSHTSTRLLTLTGPGGSGKTRLAIQSAIDLVDAFADGVWWVELAALAEPALVPHAVAKALGVRETPSRAVLQAIIEHVQSRSLVLLLDNCEHLLEACARLVDRLLAAAPRLAILATSREALGLPGETIWPVLSLVGPSGDPSFTSVAESESGRLFIERAQAVRPDFALTAHNASEVAEICRRLDCLPLALELAAAQTLAFSTGQIAARLAGRFNGLASGSRAALPRHQTLRAAINWSCDLLSPDERAFLRGLAVFAGGFDLDAVEAVVAPGLAGSAALLLERLVRKSLLVAEHLPEGPARYRLLETIRAHARAELEAAGEAAESGDRHLAYYAGLAHRAAAALRTGQQGATLDQLEAAHDNLLAALDFAEQTPGRAEAGLTLAGIVWRFWWSRGRYQLGRARLEQALARPEAAAPTAGRARALLGLGGLLHVQGDYGASAEVLTEADGLFARFGLEAERAATLVILGVGAHETGNNRLALELEAKSSELAARAGDTHTEANALNNLGHILLEENRLEEARGYVERAAAVWRAVGNEHSLAFCLYNLGEITRRSGDHAGARRWHEQSLAIRRRLADQPRVGWSLFALGRVAHEQGDLVEAHTLLAEALTIFRQLDDRPGLAHALLMAGRVALRQENSAGAVACLAESLRLHQALGLEQGAVESLAGLAVLAAADSQAERAARLLGAVESWLDRLQLTLPPAEAQLVAQAANLARAGLQPAVFAAAWAEGQALAAQGAAALVAHSLDLYG